MTFDEIAAKIDSLCQQRAADYPARNQAYQQLTQTLMTFCHWLQTQPAKDWQPDPYLTKTAVTLAPIFMCGYHKSGTTFVRDLLDGHPELSVLPADSGLLHTWQQVQNLQPKQRLQFIQEQWIHRLINPTGLPPFWLLGHTPTPYLAFLKYLDYWFHQEPNQQTMTPTALAFYCANPSRPMHARYWLDKRPLQELQIETLLSLYPSATFIHVVRNPLAVLAARKKMSQQDSRKRFILSSQIDEFRHSLQQGITYRTKLGASRYLIIRYEDVITKPEQIMRHLSQQLSITYDETLLQPTINNQPSTPNSAYRENRVRGAIQKRSLDKWRTILTPKEQHSIVTTLYPEASAYQYEWQSLLPSPTKRVYLQTQQKLSRFPRKIWHRIKTKK